MPASTCCERASLELFALFCPAIACSTVAPCLSRRELSDQLSDVREDSPESSIACPGLDGSGVMALPACAIS